MDDALRAQIILAAVAATGPDDETSSWQAKVADTAARITALIHEKSPVSKLVEQVSTCKVFPATVSGISKEKSSTRGLVTLKTSPSKFHADGVETARTERTDNEMGRAMATRIKSLVGHRVMLWVELESVNDGATKVRIIRHVEDLGADSAADETSE